MAPVELTSKHGLHLTLIASYKRQAVEGMAGAFAGTSDAIRAARDEEGEKLHAKIGQLVVERDFFRKPSFDEREPEAGDGRTCSPPLVDFKAVLPAADQSFVLLMRPSTKSERDVGADDSD